jgi:hypothetical protein
MKKNDRAVIRIQIVLRLSAKAKRRIFNTSKN